MSVYFLLTNSTVVPSPSTAAGNIQQSATPWGAGNPHVTPPQQTFQLEVNGTAGNVSGTVQIVGSNDDGQLPQQKNWTAVSTPLAAASTYLTAQASLTTNASFKHYGAYLTALSGTGAAATCKMSA